MLCNLLSCYYQLGQHHINCQPYKNNPGLTNLVEVVLLRVQLQLDDVPVAVPVPKVLSTAQAPQPACHHDTNPATQFLALCHAV